jgi:deoxyhypusine synthase
MAKTGFQGRRLGESVEIWSAMIRDPECTIFLGLSGCTFEEAFSWGKESPTSSKVQVFCDATIALPPVASALVARGERRGNNPRYGSP